MKHLSTAVFLFLFCSRLFSQCPNGGSVSGLELVTNGDFSGGNIGFTSQYTYCNSSQCLFPEAYYAVGTNPTFYHSAFFGNDHTTGTGKFLIVNGAGAAGTKIWCETVPVQQNTTYIFSYWACSVVTSSPAILQASINGVITGGFCNAPFALYSWVQGSTSWFSGSNTTVDICIVNQNTALSGNDFGVDDVSFQPCNCTALNADAGPAVTICDGDSAHLSASGGIAYAWTTDPNLSDTSIADPYASPNATDTYYVTIHDNLGCTASDSTIVTVNPLPLVTISNDTTICSGKTAPLHATGGTGYSWSPSAGLNNPLIATPLATPLVTTMYVATVTNAAGCVSKDSVLVTINQSPAIVITSDTAICTGSGLQLSVTGGNAYTWSPATGLSSSTSGSPFATPLTSTTYHVIVTNAAGCTAIDSVAVTINPLPTIVINADTTICPGTPAQLSASGGTIYSWAPAATLSNPFISNPVASPSSTTVYHVNVTDAAGCSSSNTTTVNVNPAPVVVIGNDTTICIGTAASLHVTGGTNYTWSPAGDLSNASVSNPTANPLSTTTYHVTVADNIGCEANDSMIVFVNPLPVPVVSNDTAICFGTAASLHASGGTNYSWSPGTGLSNAFVSNPQSNPSATTTYHVTVADNIGCSSLDSVTVFVNPLPQPLLSADTAICKGTIASLTASGGLLYQWSNGSNGDHIDVSPSLSTTYSVSVTDTNSCTASAIVNVTVDPLEITLYGDHDICVGESTQIQASGANTYLWNTGSQQPFIVVEPQTDSVFTVMGNDGLCADTSTFSLIVHQQPPADAGPDLSIILNDEVTLDASGGVSCAWSPPDGLSCTDCCDPVAGPHDTTIYKVIVTDVYGCSAVDSLLIIVIPPDDIFFPDAFTPNGDGLNDEFFPILSGHTQMQLLRVFNRWGELVFQSKEPSSGWDGTFQGKPESMGAYVYSFTGINTINGKTVSKKGSVTIIR